MTGEHERGGSGPTAAERDAVASAPVTPRVLLFFDYACPFCYIDMHRFERLGEDYPIELVLVPFELRPGMPLEGFSATEQGLRHSENVEAYMLRVAREEGLAMVLPDLVPNTHRAMVVGEIARDEGPDMHWRVHKAIFSAHYGEGRDIGSKEVLLDLADESGLDTAKVAEAWLGDTYEERLHAYRHLALHIGIDATPAALVCNELIIGSRPYKVLQGAIDRCLLTPGIAAHEAGEGGPGAEGEPPTVGAAETRGE